MCEGKGDGGGGGGGEVREGRQGAQREVEERGRASRALPSRSVSLALGARLWGALCARAIGTPSPARLPTRHWLPCPMCVPGSEGGACRGQRQQSFPPPKRAAAPPRAALPPPASALARSISLSLSLQKKTDLVVLVRAVREVEAGDRHARPQQLLQDGDLPGLGAEGADDLKEEGRKKGRAIFFVRARRVVGRGSPPLHRAARAGRRATPCPSAPVACKMLICTGCMVGRKKKEGEARRSGPN